MADLNTRKKNGPVAHHWSNQIDFFATPVPSFNFEGKAKVGSSCGMIATFIFVAAMIYYAGTGFIYMVKMHNPLLSTVIYSDFYDSSEENAFNLAEMETQLAF